MGRFERGAAQCSIHRCVVRVFDQSDIVRPMLILALGHHAEAFCDILPCPLHICVARGVIVFNEDVGGTRCIFQPEPLQEGLNGFLGGESPLQPTSEKHLEVYDDNPICTADIVGGGMSEYIVLLHDGRSYGTRILR